ncbi:MAG: hypothetical protein HC853_10195 [Anaerolineae bacterium]|nr:hypothetical protein [Anaerolineae bacterium]
MDKEVRITPKLYAHNSPPSKRLFGVDATCRVTLQALTLYTEAEEEALQVVEQYTPAAADSISYGTFMKLKINELANNSEVK